MLNLDKRVAQLEGAQANANLKTMTDDELSAYTRTQKNGTPRWWGAVLASVMRHGSALRVVKDDPDYAGGDAHEHA